METVGEIFDREGPCLFMVKVLELGEKHNRQPVGEWDYWFASDPRWRLIVNGGGSDEWQPAGAFAPVKRFECAIEYNGWLVASFNAVGGAVIGLTEARILEALERELAV